LVGDNQYKKALELCLDPWITA